MKEKSDRWLSVKEICLYIGASSDSVYRWVGIHDFLVHRMGRLFKFNISETDARLRLVVQYGND